ncbi:MAG: hypothetical protein QF475_01530, partial [Candidatus Undinarchaeales archaeon]|nr:hypothetical protein [Candidatus Undinarchaeales archaeon]
MVVDSRWGAGGSNFLGIDFGSAGAGNTTMIIGIVVVVIVLFIFLRKAGKKKSSTGKGFFSRLFSSKSTSTSSSSSSDGFLKNLFRSKKTSKTAETAAEKEATKQKLKTKATEYLETFKKIIIEVQSYLVKDTPDYLRILSLMENLEKEIEAAVKYITTESGIKGFIKNAVIEFMDRLLKNVKIVIQLLKGKHYDNIRVYTNDIQNDVESAMATVSKIKNAKSESAQEKIVDEM